jgi:hypothetical protein
MLSGFSQCALTFALAINIEHVKGIMVESVDGSFVPWSFVARAPGEGLAVRMKNNQDLAYLVSSHRSTNLLSANQVIGNCPYGLVLVSRPVFLARPHSIMPCDRHSFSADPNGRFPFAGPYLSSITSGRCQ